VIAEPEEGELLVIRELLMSKDIPRMSKGKTSFIVYVPSKARFVL